MQLADLTAMFATLRQDAARLRRYGAEAQATAIEATLAQLEATNRVAEEEPLTLQNAAQRSGYSVDHLGRLVRDGDIPNAGRPGAPRILARDLPSRPGVRSAGGTSLPLPRHEAAGYDPNADARALRSRRGGR